MMFQGHLNHQSKEVEDSVNEIEGELLKALLMHNDKDNRVIFLMLLKISLSFLNTAVNSEDNSRLVLHIQTKFEKTKIFVLFSPSNLDFFSEKKN